MSKTYRVIRSFWIGELNKELKADSEIVYDENLSSITIGSQVYEVKNLKAAIKAGWLIPIDGILPDLDGPVGETADQAAMRRRKERFVELAKKDRDMMPTDHNEVVSLGGCVKDDNVENFAKALNLDPLNPKKGKFQAVVEEEDARVVKTGIMSEGDKEVKELKTALKQEKTEKVETKDFKVFNDHYDSEAVHVSTYTELNKENTIKNWSTLHWTKKADIIDKSDKGFLEKIKNLESSEKIVTRINKRMQTL